MRIVIDMQGAQTESRFRGIGRYSVAFAQAVVRNRGEHQIILALSGLFPDTIEPIRAAFHGLLPQENIRVWDAPGPVMEGHSGNETRRQVAEIMREAFLASLQPDLVHISSLFEGYVDDAVTSIGRFDTTTPVSVTLHDLIPLLNPEHYLAPNPQYESYYLRKIAFLKRASCFLAISESSKRECISCLPFSAERCTNTSEAADAHFQPLLISDDDANRFRQKFSITRPFVLYTGATDERKNLPRLIQAYALLPVALRARHQLVFAGKIPEGGVAHLKHIAWEAGLQPDELLFTGYVSDAELVQFYNLCRIYVFPSWHEGFGLPPLEAMSCGAPVIGANTSSLPEVIGLDEALFDPFDVAAIALHIAQALEDEAFRNRLREHGLRQSKKFSWDATAKRAIAAWESLPTAPRRTYINATLNESKLYQALALHISEDDESVCPTIAAYLALNQQTGIERQLFLDISELCQRDAATGVQRVVRNYLKHLLNTPPVGFRVEPVYATLDSGYRYARHFTQRFLDLDNANINDEPIRWQRGDIFFGLDMQHHVQLAHADFYATLRQSGVIIKFLVHDLLPIQLSKLFQTDNHKALHELWLKMIAVQHQAICVSKATADAYQEWIIANAIDTNPIFNISWVHNGADLDGITSSAALAPQAVDMISILQSRPTFLCVSTLEPRKGQQQILNAVQQLWHENIDINLVFVGREGWKIESLVEQINSHNELNKRLFWLQGISDSYLDAVYQASACLIAASINEGFGLPLIEAAQHGIPIIARDIPVFHEVAGEYAYYFKGESSGELASAMRNWLELYAQDKHPSSHNMQWLTWQQSTEKLKAALITEGYQRHQLLVDISELVQRDVKSGIQRVVRSILKEWLINPPDNYRVEPVYATPEHGYRYARQFTQQFLGISSGLLIDEPIEYAPGDIFFALDLQPIVQTIHAGFYQQMRRQGVLVKFLVHDLLCVRMQEYFLPGAAKGFTDWLDIVSQSDGAVCVSESTAEDLQIWLNENCANLNSNFAIKWSHNGADLDSSVPTTGLPDNAELVLKQLNKNASFLMVGTIEPRKAHAQTLQAFEQLWQSGNGINLAIVGKQGWMVEGLVERLRTHPELNKRLFWLEGISDEYLEKVYAASACLIAASYGEGFGLPLIEAAQHQLPIIARDIPVFREVAGKHAFYFNASVADDLAHAIQQWLKLHQQDEHPKSINMPWLTWKQSAQQLLRCLNVSRGTERLYQ